LLLVTACGRIGFGERATGDASGGDTATDAPIMWSHLIAYADQTCALRGGVAYCWGSNSKGQLGDGTTMNARKPVQLALPAGTVNDLAMGETHGAAIVDGMVYGFGSLDGAPAPTAVTSSSTGPLPTATAIACGRDFSCVIADGAFCWGTNSVGQLGLGDMTARSMPTLITSVPATPNGIRAGDDHACATTATTVSMCWGHNDSGALGYGSTTTFAQANPTYVGGGFVHSLPLIAGWHACALESGNVWCWGTGTAGEIGDGKNMDDGSPVQLTSLANVTAIATGGGPTDGDASCAIVGGNVSCWGNGFYGRLGQGVANPSSVPVGVVGLPGPSISVAIGYDHACALLADGDIYCWGRGDLGQLGDGLMTSSLAPVGVVAP
jgi:alpha-tubulin suppressor-like RCC1 family protein